MDLHGKKISVIGGAGFVGTNFCQNLLEKQIQFEIIDIAPSRRFPEQYIEGDVRDLNSLRAAITGDIVVNLAAVHRDDVSDKSEYFTTNVGGAENLVRVCTEKGISKIVFTSTVAVYGFAESGTDESGAINPFNEYGRTKHQAEQVFQNWCADEKNSLIIVRPTVIFGEGNRGNVFNLFNQIASGKFLMIGKGTNKKSMAYIGNVVLFLEACLRSGQKMAVYNYVDTPDLSMNELVQQVRRTLRGKSDVGMRLPYWFGLALGYAADFVAKLTGRKLPVSSIRVEKFCADTAFSSRALQIEGFAPKFSLQEAVQRTLEAEFVSPDPTREIFFTE